MNSQTVSSEGLCQKKNIFDFSTAENKKIGTGTFCTCADGFLHFFFLVDEKSNLTF